MTPTPNPKRMRVNFIPAICPNCGYRFGIKNDKEQVFDFLHGLPCTCDCGVKFVYDPDLPAVEGEYNG